MLATQAVPRSGCVVPNRFGRRPILRGARFAGLALAVLLVASSGCNRGPESGGRYVRATPERLERFGAAVDRLRQELKIPGMAVAVLEGGELVWSRGFGLADRERGVPVTADTPFHLASVTKALASVTVLGLEEEGILDLDDRVVDFSTSFPFERLGIDEREALSLRHLITHTSDGPPGSRYRYDGDLYCVLDLAAWRLGGRDFRELFLAEIGGPLGMARTVPNPVDPGLVDRFLDWLRARGEEPVLRGADGRPFDIRSLRELYDDPSVRSLLFVENLIPGAMATAGNDSTLFSYRDPQRIDARTQVLFNEFFREDNAFLDVYAEMARPYRLDDQGNVVRGRYRSYFSTGAGFISTVRDLAAFDAALDAGRLLEKETIQRAWSPYRLANGRVSPYGLGWFVEEYGGRRLVWHGGEWDCIGALYLKVPDDNLTLITMANSRTLSGGFAMSEGTVLNSGFGVEFLRIFVFEPAAGAHGPDVDWRDEPATIVERIATVEDETLRGLWWHQLRNMEMALLRMGETEAERRLLREAHGALFDRLVGAPHANLAVLAEIVEVGDEEHRTVDFSLRRDEAVRVYAIGEITEEGRWDWGWIEDAASGRIVWEMTLDGTVNAGGSSKNRKADVDLRLPPGDYRLHYRSDDSHAYMDWNAMAPDHLFWGISICRL